MTRSPHAVEGLHNAGGDVMMHDASRIDNRQTRLRLVSSVSKQIITYHALQT